MPRLVHCILLYKKKYAKSTSYVEVVKKLTRTSTERKKNVHEKYSVKRKIIGRFTGYFKPWLVNNSDSFGR